MLRPKPFGCLHLYLNVDDYVAFKVCKLQWGQQGILPVALVLRTYENSFESGSPGKPALSRGQQLMQSSVLNRFSAGAAQKRLEALGLFKELSH
jgi:hypothetical protein